MTLLKPFTLLVLVLLAAPVTAAPAEGRARTLLEKARGEQARARYEAVLETVARALAAGDADRATLVSLYRLQGEADSVLGLVPDAVEAFEKALELMPTLGLTADAPPKIRRPFQEARAKLGPRPGLSVGADSRQVDAQRVETRMSVEGDQASLVSRFELQPFAPDASRVRSESRIFTWRCVEPPCAHQVLALDVQGNALAALGSEAAPLIAARLPERPVAMVHLAARNKSFFARPWPYLVLAGVLGASTAYLGYRFAHDQSELGAVVADRSGHSPADYAKWDNDRRAVQPWLWTTAIGTGAAGTVAIIVW